MELIFISFWVEGEQASKNYSHSISIQSPVRVPCHCQAHTELTDRLPRFRMFECFAIQNGTASCRFFWWSWSNWVETKKGAIEGGGGGSAQRSQDADWLQLTKTNGWNSGPQGTRNRRLLPPVPECFMVLYCLVMNFMVRSVRKKLLLAVVLNGGVFVTLLH